MIVLSEQLGQKPAVVGASLGGLAGLIAEGEIEPGCFKSLTLVDITPRMEPIGNIKVVGFMSSHLKEGFESLEQAVEAIASYMPQRPKSKDLTGLSRYLREDADGRFRWHWDPKFITNVMTTEGKRRFERLDEAAARLKLPVQLVRGRLSEIVSEASAAAFRNIVPHVVYNDISDAGHMVAGDSNHAFLEAIKEFLETTKETSNIGEVQ